MLKGLYNDDCMNIFALLEDKTVDMVCTDIPYGECKKESHMEGQNLNKGKANTVTFDLEKFVSECERVCRGSILIFCGMEQYSTIFSHFSMKNEGTTRCIVWKKSNPNPMNGQHIYLSGAELCVWYKPKGWRTFNAFCKSNVFEYPCGTSKVHPTEKNYELIRELVLDNTEEGDVVLDPCMGSGTTGAVCAYNARAFIGVELDKEYFDIACKRIKKAEENYQPPLF